MQTSKLAKSILNYLPLVAVMAAAIIGMFMAKDPYQTSPDSRVTTPAQLLMVPGAERPCISPLIHTSLPAKCKTADGKFIQRNEMSPNVFVVPEGK